MKRIVLILLSLNIAFSAVASPIDSIFFKQIAQINLSTKAQLTEINSEELAYQNELYAINQRIEKDEINLHLINRKIDIQYSLTQMESQRTIELTKNRYKKGISVIKLLYEKVLDLEHHLLSMRIQQKFSNMVNPNSYAVFKEIDSAVDVDLKKNKVEVLPLPPLLESNPYVVTAHFLISSAVSLINNKKAKAKRQQLDEVSCVIDFTVRMHTNLNAIYYEAAFLREKHSTVKERCTDLFKAYSQVINYNNTLSYCRDEDDWEAIYELIDNTIDSTASQQRNAYKQQIDMEFELSQLLVLIDDYIELIEQGESYYKKFQLLLTNSSDTANCINQLSEYSEYTNLHTEITTSIERFSNAYNIAELRGSKLKSLMYGYEF